VNYTIHDPEENNRFGYGTLGQLTNGVIYFSFTNRLAGLVDLAVGGVRQTRLVDAPVADWLVELPTNAPGSANPNPPVLRNVIVRLQSPDGVAPRGVIDLTVPSYPNNLQSGYYIKRVTLTNGEARLTVPVGALMEYAMDKALLGYWFESGANWTNVPPGEGPFIIVVPVIPAGAIAARVRNADGSPAANVYYSILVLKPSPAVADKSFNNYDPGPNFSDDVPRQYLSPPLPLGGNYEILGNRGNAFCTSGPLKLTEESPNPEVELQFPPGQDLTGRVLAPDGQPAGRVTVSIGAQVKDHGFQLAPVTTDARGNFRVAGCSPDLANYTLNATPPGFASQPVKVNFNRLPVTLQLIPGLKLSGRVTNRTTGLALSNTEVRAWTDDQTWPEVKTHTDAQGNYEFNTLAAATYQIFVDSASFSMNYDHHFRAGVVTNLNLAVKPWSTGN
jgi:hypothetical protein